MTSRVRLREPTVGDVELLDAWDESLEFRGEFNDFGMPHNPNAERLEKGFIGELSGTLIVERIEDTLPLGTIDWRPAMYGPPPQSTAFQLGISLAPEARGQGYGSEALRLVAEYLFQHTKTNRVEGSCDVENLPSQRMMEKAGFRYEGTLRGAQYRHNAYHDLMYFAVLRGEV